MRLTQAQIKEFHAEGFLVVENLFAEEDLQPVIDEINVEIDRLARELVASGELSRTYGEEGFLTRLTRIQAETDKVYFGIASGRLSGPGIFSSLTNPKLLDLVESLVGPEIIATSIYRLRPKVPRLAYGVVPWHQDSGFFEPYCDKSLILTVWIPMVDATAERGCMQVMPRAHLGDVFYHTLFSPETARKGARYYHIPDEALPEGNIVTVPVNKGGVLLMTNRTPHRSIENTSDVVRWSVDLRYQSADLPTNARSDSGDLIREPFNPSEPIACYPPEADFLVRSKKRPQDVITDWQRFDQMRRSYERVPVTKRWDN
jgi:phytanoyl-CoA hydroxylase